MSCYRWNMRNNEVGDVGVGLSLLLIFSILIYGAKSVFAFSLLM